MRILAAFIRHIVHSPYSLLNSLDGSPFHVSCFEVYYSMHMQSKIDIDLLRARISGAKQACEKKRATHMRTAICINRSSEHALCNTTLIQPQDM